MKSIPVDYNASKIADRLVEMPYYAWPQKKKNHWVSMQFNINFIDWSCLLWLTNLNIHRVYLKFIWVEMPKTESFMVHITGWVHLCNNLIIKWTELKTWKLQNKRIPLHLEIFLIYKQRNTVLDTQMDKHAYWLDSMQPTATLTSTRSLTYCDTSGWLKISPTYPDSSVTVSNPSHHD